ncbi:MAG: DUF3516 domain-containing protein, partial [Actinomycetes bacterium]
TGTDSLGVGVNLPLRTVLLTGLAKYDGRTNRILSAREFHQITGRAGRPGFDPSGLAVVSAPEHEIDNERAVEKAAGDPKRLRKLVKSKPPRGYVPWNQAIFDRLVAAPPEPLTSSFRVSHSLMLNVLDRPGDGCAALRRLLVDNDDPRPAQRTHIRQAIAMYRSLLGAGALERLEWPDDEGRRVRVTSDLQSDFALNAPLSPFILEAVPLLDRDAPTWTLDVLSMVESTLDNPGPVLSAQLDRLRTETITRLKAEGVEFEARMEALDQLEHPKPLREFTYDLFDRYRLRHAWAADYNIAPKSVARDLYEQAMSFGEYVAHYGLARSEGLVLRYLSDAYRGLQRSVPSELKTDELEDLTEWLGELVRQVDSSLLDEWEALAAGPAGPEGHQQRPAIPIAAPAELAAVRRRREDGATRPLTANDRAFTVMV